VISEAASPGSVRRTGPAGPELAARTLGEPRRHGSVVSAGTSIDRCSPLPSTAGRAGPRCPAPTGAGPRSPAQWLTSRPAAPGRAGALGRPDRRHHQPGARGPALRAHGQGAPAPPRPVPAGADGRPGACLRALRGGPPKRDMDSDVLHGPSSPTALPGLLAGPSCSCSSTTTAVCSCTGAGSPRRTPGPAKTSCARPFPPGPARNFCMSITGPRMPTTSSPGPAPCSV